LPGVGDDRVDLVQRAGANHLAGAELHDLVGGAADLVDAEIAVNCPTLELAYTHLSTGPNAHATSQPLQ
jgi:hypothetical protein